MRRSKQVKKDADEVLEKYNQIAKIQAEAEAEEKEALDNISKMIDEKCEAINAFCGVILTKEDVSNIVKLALETGESIRIKYKMYYNE